MKKKLRNSCDGLYKGSYSFLVLTKTNYVIY